MNQNIAQLLTEDGRKYFSLAVMVRKNDLSGKMTVYLDTMTFNEPKPGSSESEILEQARLMAEARYPASERYYGIEFSFRPIILDSPYIKVLGESI
jgi:hypothetical protein